MKLQIRQRADDFVSLSPRCTPCPFKRECGGRDPLTSFFNCFDDLCCGKGTCDEVCAKKSDFFDRLVEVRGLRFDNMKPVSQAPIDLPFYVPHLPHRYSRLGNLACSWVSLSPYQLLRSDRGRCVLRFKDGEELRKNFGIRDGAKVVFRGVDKDKFLERYWARRRQDGLTNAFKRMGGSLFIGPNYSHFGDVPRTDNLFNRKRQLICLEEMCEAGIDVAPHLNDAVAADWEFWLSYLLANPTISIVAKEFQTRCRKRVEGTKAIERVADLQQRLGRELQLIIIGGAQHLETAARFFRRVTLLDCRPVIAANNYHRFVPRGLRGKSQPEPQLPGFGADRLADENIATYENWIIHRFRVAAAKHRIADRRAS